MNNIQYAGGLHHTLEGHYRVSVIDGQTNEIVWEQPNLQKNLILNQGMDAIDTTYYSELSTVAISGDGPRLNYINPAGSMISQLGNIITLVPTGSGTGLNHFTESFGNYSVALTAGDVIQYSTGSGGITTVIVTGVSDLTASVNTSLTISPSQSFTIWKTTQTGLQHELQRSNTYLVGAAYCGVTTATGSRTYYRTYDFLTESVAKTYQEIGVGWSAVSGSSTVFSRVVLDTPVLVSIGQRLRVFYQIRVGLSPTSSVSRPNVTISGWPISPSTNTNGSESIQSVLMSFIDSNGTSIPSFAALDPAGIGSACIFYISHISASLQPFGSAVSRTGTSPTAALEPCTKIAYTAGSYMVDKTATFSAASWDGNNIRSMGFCYANAEASNQAFAFVFEQSQSKANTQTLTLAYRWTWDRTFTN